MRKVVITAILMLAMAGSAVAELDMDAKSFYAQGILSLPTGDWGDFAGTGFGGGVGMKVPYSPEMSFRAEAGYLMYGGKEFANYDYSYSMIPILVLVEYQMKPEDAYYLLGGAGFTRVKFDAEYTGPAIDDFFGLSNVDFDLTSTEFTLTVGGGFDVNEQIAIEGRFNMVSDANYITVNGIYSF